MTQFHQILVVNVINEEYDRRMEDIKLSKIKTKSKRGYRIIHKYDVILINYNDQLIKPMTRDNDSKRCYVKNKEIFYILYSEIKLKYCNITK